MLLCWSHKVTSMEQDKITQCGLEHWSKIGIINKNVEIRDAFRPFIDSEANHGRHFFKITLINKGIDFIDLPSKY